METLSKIAIYIAIAVGISFFIMFIIIALPHMMQDAERQWREAFAPKKSAEELKQIFYEHPSYKTFIQKYPKAGEYFRDYGNGGGSLEVTAMNFETYNTLQLELSYDRDQDSVHEDVSCYNDNHDMHHRVRGTLTQQFIEQANCLEGDGIISSPSPLIDGNGKPIPSECGPGTNLNPKTGLCVVTSP